MPGQQPKQGLRYEILVASALKTEVRRGEGWSLDLTSFEFNVNPAKFKTELTGIGFDVDIDMTAIRDDITFLIECKSSSIPGQVVRVKSEEFLKTLLEFVALQNFSEMSGWQYRYLLATDYDIGLEIRDIMKNKTTDQLNRVAELLKKFGMERYQDKLNSNLITPELLRRTLNATSMDDRLTYEYLKEKLASNEMFQKHHNDFSSRASRPSSAMGGQGGFLALQGSYVRVSCLSEAHETCEEVTVAEVLCHLGNASALVAEIIRILQTTELSLCYRISSQKLVFSLTVVDSSSDVDAKDIASVLSEALTRLAGDSLAGKTILVTPGTLDIVVADRARLASLVKARFDAREDKYDLRGIDEMRAFGPLVKIALARKVLREEYTIVSRAEHYKVEEILSPDETTYTSDAL